MVLPTSAKEPAEPYTDRHFHVGNLVARGLHYCADKVQEGDQFARGASGKSSLARKERACVRQMRQHVVQVRSFDQC
jgi:hypothetical protein